MMMMMTVVSGESGQCEEISIPMCKEIGYNLTRLPNQFNHETQDEVGIFLFIDKSGILGNKKVDLQPVYAGVDYHQR